MVVEKILGPKYYHQSCGLYGFTGSLGWTRIGGIAFGFDNDEAGVLRTYVYSRGRVTNKYPFYMQWAPRTAAQNVASGNFANGMAAWAALTQEQKNEYNLKAKRAHLHGVNLYMREWMLS